MRPDEWWRTTNFHSSIFVRFKLVRLSCALLNEKYPLNDPVIIIDYCLYCISIVYPTNIKYKCTVYTVKWFHKMVRMWWQIRREIYYKPKIFLTQKSNEWFSSMSYSFINNLLKLNKLLILLLELTRMELRQVVVLKTSRWRVGNPQFLLVLNPYARFFYWQISSFLNGKCKKS